ncbi:histidine kinase [Prolixibacteraceae bacterium Z1-6]|uniref:Histidine kinase n=1 Tax=Draconibacterium aestuarii TaxID=2998507 RepID=A0A9X3F699_9BACT|nr:histidine kinase [Prolixibacteraceae bacterium Z1-6]
MKCLDLHNRKKQALAMRLPSYKPLSILVRFIIVSIIAISVLNLIEFLVGTRGQAAKPAYYYYVLIIISFNMVAESQIILDNILERFLPVPEKIKLRLAIQFVSGLLVLILVLKVLLRFIEPQLLDASTRPGIFMGLLLGLLFVQMTASSLAVARFTQKWVDSQEQIAEMKREKLRMDYNSLQDQLNPHFLFNNLSVLKSLIIYDSDSALKFTENFTDVYRYVLQSKDKRLVKVAEEIEFIESYISLHKERVGAGLEVESSILTEDLGLEIAPLTLQLLVENAIKHNVTSRETPLKIVIDTDANYLTVSNSLNRRVSSYSTKTGLKNLVKRYEMLTSEEIVVQYDDERFEVKVPLL